MLSYDESDGAGAYRYFNNHLYRIFGTEPEESSLRREKVNGSDIARILGVSRSAVSRSLKQSLEKIYFYLLEKNNYSPYETYVLLGKMLTVCYDCQEEIDDFWFLLPDNARNLIRKDAKKRFKSKTLC